jgi:hypothetical protein
MTWQRRKAGSKRRWYDFARTADAILDTASYEYRVKPGSKNLSAMPGNAFFWVRIDDEPSPGYTTSVHLKHTSKGPRINFVGVGLTPTPLDELALAEDGPPWYSDIPTAGQNEAGINAKILKSLSLTRIRRALSKELATMQGYDDASISLAAGRIVKDLGRSRRQTLTPVFLARLAAAYVSAVKLTGGYKVYEELGEDLKYEPETLRSYVKLLRKEGYLTEGSRGIASGDLTDKTTDILRAEGLL